MQVLCPYLAVEECGGWGGRWVFHNHFHLDSFHVMCKGLGWLFESGWSLGPARRDAPPTPPPPSNILPEAGRRRLCCSQKLAENLKDMGGKTGQWSCGPEASLKNVSDVHSDGTPRVVLQ